MRRVCVVATFIAGLVIAEAAIAELGACCMQVPPCFTVDYAWCEQLGSVYQGDGTDCDEVACGACCATVGFRVVTGEESCQADFVGLHHGEGTLCESVNRPEPLTRITYQG